MPINEEDSIAHIHLDYSGIHSLITTINGDNFYLNLKLFKLTLLKRLKVNNFLKLFLNIKLLRRILSLQLHGILILCMTMELVL